MTKEEFLNRFNKKTQKLKRGFFEMAGKKYYSLYNSGRGKDGINFVYFVFLKAFHDIANSIGMECVNPEFVNVSLEKGVISGDIIMEDFSHGERKVKINGLHDDFVESDKHKFRKGELVSWPGITLEEQMKQFKSLAEYYENPNIYQSFLKHMLFHFYFGDEDFHFQNIEVFIDNDFKTRVSPLYDFGGVYYYNPYTVYDENVKYPYNTLFFANKFSPEILERKQMGLVYEGIHISPKFVEDDYISLLKDKRISKTGIDDQFYINCKVLANYKGYAVRSGSSSIKKQKNLIIKAISDLEDKKFIKKLFAIDIDKCLVDVIYNDKFKRIIENCTIPCKKLIEKAYEEYLMQCERIL